MHNFKYNKIFIIMIIVGLISALMIDFQRHQVEERNNTVELAIDYEGLLRLSEMTGTPIDEVFRQAKESGITSLAVYETTFKKLNANGKTTAVSGSSLLTNYYSGAMVDPEWRALVENGTIKGSMIYITGHDAQTFKEVTEDLYRRLGHDRVRELTVGGKTVLEVNDYYEEFLKANIGMPTDEMKLVNEAGFYVMARPSNYAKCSKDDVDAVFKRLEGIKVSNMTFSGKECLGSPDEVNYVVEKLQERDITLGMIEGVTQLQFYPQNGLLEIAKAMDYKAARLYGIGPDEMAKMQIQQAVDRWSNTDPERNIRIDLLRIFEKPQGNMTLLETNMKYFSETRDMLERSGYKIGPAGTFEPFYPSSLLRAVVMMGVAAAIVLYLSLIAPSVKEKYLYMLLAVLVIGMAGPVLMGHGNKIRVIAALASANFFPAIAVIWQLDRIRAAKADVKASLLKIIPTAMLALFASGIISYAGAAYLSASLADTEYLLEVNIFRGIKLTFVLPLVLVAIAFLQRFDIFDGKMDDTDGVINQLKKILDMPVKIKTLLGLGFVLIAGIVFVARSGHTSGMPVAGAELKFRAFLEHLMWARPRSKELLIGHPGFMLAALAWWRQWPTMILFVLVIVATIGQGSMVETFAHMRTPIYMSFVRGLGGIGLGAIIGAVAMALVQLWNSVLQPRIFK
ncbi:MAG: DUF5693 family protein [Selenomonadaceae bacterium]|nr:DUF5693 family protein [Selenomonadaceae bacterium]MEE1363072.1 DUF5693 family protein [Selenomonadaceae bacterium]